MGRRRHAFIGWDEGAIWLERNGAVEWKLSWRNLAGLRAAYAEGGLTMRVGSDLVDDSGQAYRLPVHWRTQYPRDVQQAFQEILRRLPPGKSVEYATCPRPTTAGAYRVLGMAFVLCAFGFPVIPHLMPSSSYMEADSLLLLTQTFALMGGLGVLVLGLVDLLRAKRSAPPSKPV